MEENVVGALALDDSKEICRICLGILSVEKVSLFEGFELEIEHAPNIIANDRSTEMLTICDILLQCSSNITISNDDEFSKEICVECFDKLRHFYEFRQQIEKSDQILRNRTILGKTTTGVTGDADEPIENVESDKMSAIACRDIINLNSHVDSEMTCIVCQRTFSSSKRKQIHLIRKHSVRSDENIGREYKCHQCDKVYTTRSNLIIHERIHSGTKSFKCDECGRAFYDESALISHTSIHTGLKPFKCVECDRHFTTANILQQHRKKHSSLRPHKCSMCPRAFYTSNELRIHFRMHTQEQPYLCCQCGKRFTRKTHLNIHLRTHTGIKPFKCQFCEKSFALSGDLTAHIRIHTGEKPYECRICEKTFNQSSARNIHMRVHTGKRNYVCHVCQAAFTQSASLRRHVAIHIHSDFNENSDSHGLI